MRKERVSGTTAGGRGGEVHPYQRDTTAGHTNSEFPSMHDNQLRMRLYPLCCTICGLQFGFALSAELKGLCRSCAWLHGGDK